eukprot:TRINITY_DN21760_c0_g1_i1.p1 TRINITY_DN21760_c0_g1~~TRINITY_DN21760_c0_g1_i1.p1  ORF type:complete len:226 (+),score=82.20 TRINITY_DN21760_c0_g1_i1:57-734(+)
MSAAEAELWARIRSLEIRSSGPAPVDDTGDDKQESPPGSPQKKEPEHKTLAERSRQLIRDFRTLTTDKKTMDVMSQEILKLQSICYKALEQAHMLNETGQSEPPIGPSYDAKLRYVLCADAAQHRESAQTLESIAALSGFAQSDEIVKLVGLYEDAAAYHAQQRERRDKALELRQRLTRVAEQYRRHVEVTNKQMLATSLTLSQWEDVVNDMLERRGLPLISEQD